MPAGWRTLGASKPKRSRERGKRKRQNLSTNKINNDPPAAAAAVSRVGMKSSDEDAFVDSTAVSRDIVKNLEVRTSPQKTTIEVPDGTTQKHDMGISQNLTPTADSTDESTVDLTPAVEKIEPKTAGPVVAPNIEIKEVSPEPQPKVRTPEQVVVKDKPKCEEKMYLSPIKTRLDLDVVEVKPRLKKSLNFRSNVPKKKKKVNKTAEKIAAANNQNNTAPEQTAGAVQGISMLWKNEFSRDAKKKIEQVKLSQLWKSMKSGKKDDINKGGGVIINNLPKPNLQSIVNITSNSVPTGPPAGLTSLGCRPSEWHNTQRTSTENSFFVPPKVPKKPNNSKLNPFVKEFTPTPTAPKKFQFSHEEERAGKMKTMQAQQAPTQPFIRQNSGTEMYNNTVPIYNTKSATLPVASTSMLNVQNRPIGANRNVVQAPIMNNAVLNTHSYDFNRQNIRMINPLTQSVSRTPSHLSSTPILAPRNLHNFIVPYSAQNLTPISAQKWQTQTVTTIPTVSNPVVTRKLQPNFSSFQHRGTGFQQRGIQRGGLSTATGLTGFSQTHHVFRPPTGQGLPQQTNSFGSHFQNSHSQTITRPSALNTLGVRSLPMQNKMVMTYSHPQGIPLTKPIARPVLSRPKPMAPLHTASLEPLRRHSESPQINTNIKPVSTLGNELRHEQYNEPRSLKSRNDSAQWTLPRPLDISNRFSRGVFDSPQHPKKSVFIDNQPLDWNHSNLPVTQTSAPSILPPWASIWSIPHTEVFSFLTIHDLSVLRRVSKSMERIVRETPYITNMVIDGTQGVIGINNMGVSKGKWVHDLDKVMRTYTSKGIRRLELEPSTYAKFFWTKFLDWLTKDETSNLKSVLVLKGSADEDTNEDSGISDFLVGLCPEVLKIHSGIKVDAKFLHRIDRPGVKALVFSREIKWDQEMIRAVYDREYPLNELTLACPPQTIVPWLSKFTKLEKLRLLHDSSDKSRLTDKDLVTILSTVRLVELDCSLLSTWGFPEPTASMVTTSITILTTCGESISRNWLEKTLKRVPGGLTHFHLKNLSEPLSLNHLEDVQYKQEKANLDKLRGLSTPRLQITGEQCHDCRVLGLDCCLVIV